MKIFNIFSIALLAVLISASKGDRCGGHLKGDGGKFILNEQNSNENDQVCIWVIELLSRQDVTFRLTQLESTTSIVTLYPEQNAGETLNPIKLNSKNVGGVNRFVGNTVVVILSRTDLSTGLSFEWDSSKPGSPDVANSVNFVDSERGEVIWDRFAQKERLVWALTAGDSLYQTISAETKFNACDLSNPCECSYFGLFEVTYTGDLKEVTSVCGRSTKFQTDRLSPNLLAFVFVNQTQTEVRSQSVDISWSGEVIDKLGCGGIIKIPAKGSSVFLSYKADKAYDNNENCLWTLESVNNGKHPSLTVIFTLVSNGFADNQDGLATFNYYKELKLRSNLLQMGVPTKLNGDNIYLSFTSDSAGTGTGFVVKIEVVDIFTSVQTGHNYYTSESQGTISYGPYNNFDIISIVFNPPPNQSIVYTFDFLDIEETELCNSDHLDIYEIGNLGNDTLYTRACGTTLPPSFVMHNPVLAVFAADFNTPGKGFGLSWKPTF